VTPDPSRPPRSPVRPWIVAAFTENLALKASAVLLAMVLWFVVSAREPTEEVVDVRFVPVLDSSLVLRDPPPTIRALVIGRASDILKLSTDPLVIRRQVTGDVPDTLVVSLRTTDVDVPEGAEVIVRDIEPRAITLHFEASASRMVPVRSALYLGRSGARSMPLTGVILHIDPESVSVSGPRRMVLALNFVKTTGDTIAPGDTLPHLVDIDTIGLGLQVRPPQVKATVVPPRTTTRKR
jgi:hypothetical protein